MAGFVIQRVAKYNERILNALFKNVLKKLLYITFFNIRFKKLIIHYIFSL